MKKTIFLLNIGDYEPEITKLTYPLIEQYAKKIGADVHIITDRKFPDWSIDYEKMQLYELGKDSDWVLYLDSDTVVHPDMPDLTMIFNPDTAVNRAIDFASLRWKYDKYFMRDGRHIGCCTWLVLASNLTLDIFKPLELTAEEATANIQVVAGEKANGMKPEHLQADYAMSRNVAKYGLKFETLDHYFKHNNDYEHDIDMKYFLHHEYNMTSKKKLKLIQNIISSWEI